MSKKRYKRSYFPSLRKLMKELEDSIIEKEVEREKKARDEIVRTLNKIEEAEHLRE